MYAMGLLGEGERKSMEPMAARACAAPDEVDALHQRLGHFLTDSEWSDRGVRREAASYALSALTSREPIEAWIVDDTGFLKQGKHSVEVQRQYIGSAAGDQLPDWGQPQRHHAHRAPARRLRALLAPELDGGQHATQGGADSVRDGVPDEA
jgi:hypothetical protein